MTENSFDKLLKDVADLKKRIDEPKTRSKIKENELILSTIQLLTSFIPQIHEKVTFLHAEIICVRDENKRLKEGSTLVKKSQAVIDSLTAQVSILKGENKSLKQENEEIKKELLTTQIDKSQSCAILRNVYPKNSLIKSIDEEKPHELRKAFQDILEVMKIKDQCKIANIYRLKPMENPGYTQGSFPPVKVEFLSKIDKSIFMANLKNLKDAGLEHKVIKVGPDVIKPLQNDYFLLDKKAYDIRKALPGTKTKVVIKQFQYCLLVKKPGKNSFEMHLD